MDDYDLAVDFMDMTNDQRLWTRLQDARAGFVPIAGRHVIVGDEDAVSAVARILSVNAEGHIELEVLPGSVDSHRTCFGAEGLASPRRRRRMPTVKGSMREKRPGYWEVRVFAGVDPLTGQKQYRTRTFRGTKRQASSALAVLVTEVDGGVVEPKKCTVAELLDAWLEHIENVGRSPSTLHGYRRLVRQLPPGFLAQPLAKVTPKVIDDLYRFLARQTSRKPATVLRFHTVLRAAFAQAVRWGWLDRNPIERATPPRVHSIETVPPTVVDVLRVLDRAAASRNPENALVFRIVAATGCRRGEVCALKWSDVDFDGDAARVVIRRAVLDLEGRRTVYDTKTHALRWIRIDDETARMLRAQRDRAKDLADAAGVEFSTDDFVFPRSPGSSEPLPPNRIGQAWRRLCREVGVDARLHDLRHLQASLLLDAGEAITTVSARLGHRDTSTTLKIYSHLMPGADARAAEIVGKAFGRSPGDQGVKPDGRPQAGARKEEPGDQS